MFTTALFTGCAVAVMAAVGALRASIGMRQTQRLNDSVTLKLLDATDVPALEGRFADMSATRLHELLTLQASGEESLYVAWLDGRAVGVAAICWNGPRHPLARASVDGCPEIHAVHVDPSLRSGGVGSRLLATCEGAIVARGFHCIGAEVAVDNMHAYALWLRAGYAEPRRIEYDAPGDPPQRLRFLVKSLVPSPSPSIEQR